MKKIFKQPNGKYCYFSYNGIGGFNLTEKDIKDIYVLEAVDKKPHSVQAILSRRHVLRGEGYRGERRGRGYCQRASLNRS